MYTRGIGPTPSGTRGETCFTPELLIRMKGPSIKTNLRKVRVKLPEFYSNIIARPSLFTRAHTLSKEIGMSHVFWDSL